MSKTSEALKLIDAGMNRHKAAKTVGITASQVYRAVKTRRMKSASKCPCCGQDITAGTSQQKVESTQTQQRPKNPAMPWIK